MRYLTRAEVLEAYYGVMAQTGGALGIHSLSGLESAIAQPQMTFGSDELYPTLVEKASALAFSLIQNHPFLDGNKRTGHAALELFLVINGYKLAATIDEQEQVVLSIAAGEFSREQLTAWLQIHTVTVATPATGNGEE